LQRQRHRQIAWHRGCWDQNSGTKQFTSVKGIRLTPKEQR
jgi:hypothetical protein